MQCLLNKNQSQKLYSFGRFKAIKFICEPFWALLLTQTTDFPPSHILQLLKSLPFHVPEAYKRYPFRAEPPRIGHHSEYPPPPVRDANLWRSKIWRLSFFFTTSPEFLYKGLPSWYKEREPLTHKTAINRPVDQTGET